MAKKKPAKKNIVKKKPTKNLKKKVVKKVVKKTTAPKRSALKPTLSTVKKTVTKTDGKLKLAFTPLEDRILVERLGASDKTPGGIYIPDTAKERPSKGRVLAIGGGKYDKKGRRGVLDVKVGDVVLFTQWSGNELEINREKLLIMRESDILGVVAD